MQTHKVTVDFSKSRRQMIKDGKYNWVDTRVYGVDGEISGTSQQEIELIVCSLKGTATTEQVLELLDNLGLKPAKIEDLLAFGAAYPDWQRCCGIVALGSKYHEMFEGFRYPLLGGTSKRRGLYMTWPDKGKPRWKGSRWSFLCVAK